MKKNSEGKELLTFSRVLYPVYTLNTCADCYQYGLNEGPYSG